MSQDTAEPTAAIAMVTLDCAEVAPMRDFYAGLLGWPVTYTDDSAAMLTGPAVRLGMCAIPDYQPPKWPNHGTKQFHLDLGVDDVDAAMATCVELGAREPDEQPGETWRVLLDPAGHPFCLTPAANWG